tara:strand:+ start:11231 stop:11692 length:462 start_codon:yes stop_codon:yes gene_type:complete
MTQKNWIYLILLVSLGTNLFLAGYLAGGQTNFRFGSKPSESMHLKGILKELPETSKKQLAPMLQQSKETSRYNKRKIHIARKKLLELMSEPELNKDAVKETMNTIKTLSSQNLEISQVILYEAITNASFANRLKMVDAMKRKSRRPHRQKAER